MPCHALAASFCLLFTASAAFTPIRWTSPRGEILQFMPKSFSGHLPMSYALRQFLTIGEASNRMVPQFTVNSDNTISIGDWCVEADGKTAGDAVIVNNCNGRPTQQWNRISEGHGRNMIQLKGTNLYLNVNDKEGSLIGAAVQLQTCGTESSASWLYETLRSIPIEDAGEPKAPKQEHPNDNANMVMDDGDDDDSCMQVASCSVTTNTTSPMFTNTTSTGTTNTRSSATTNTISSMSTNTTSTGTTNFTSTGTTNTKSSVTTNTISSMSTSTTSTVTTNTTSRGTTSITTTGTMNTTSSTSTNTTSSVVTNTTSSVITNTTSSVITNTTSTVTTTTTSSMSTNTTSSVTTNTTSSTSTNTTRIGTTNTTSLATTNTTRPVTTNTTSSMSTDTTSSVTTNTTSSTTTNTTVSGTTNTTGSMTTNITCSVTTNTTSSVTTDTTSTGTTNTTRPVLTNTTSGRRFKGSIVQKDIKLLPFKTVDQGGKPQISVKVNGEQKSMAPEEVPSMVLVKIEETAEKYLGKEVKHAVHTVPAYFNDVRRQSTKDVGTISGMKVMHIINEPTAAATAYGRAKKQNIPVYDLGGGTFDVSWLTIDNGAFETDATNGDAHLGGEDIDQRVMQHLSKIFNNMHSKDMSKDKGALQQLRREVEKTKRALNSTHQARIETEALFDGMDFSETLTRARLEETHNDLCKSILAPVKKVRVDSGFKKNQLDEDAHVGGSARIPKIQQLIKDLFDGKEPHSGITSDEAIAYGAAVQACIWNGEGFQDLLLLDVTPLTHGIEIVGGVMSKMISGNTVIPTKKTQIFSTDQCNQPAVNIQVFEGERPMTNDDHSLRKFELGGIPPAPRGQPQIEVAIEIDPNGILNVVAEDRGTGKSEKITMTNDKDQLTEVQIEKMTKEAEQFADEDKSVKERVNAKHAFDGYVHSMRSDDAEMQRRAECNASGVSENTEDPLFPQISEMA